MLDPQANQNTGVSGRQPLRTRRPPIGIQELLSLANSLPTEAELRAAHYEIVNSQLTELDPAGSHYAIFALGTFLRTISESQMKHILTQAIQELPTELTVFVNPTSEAMANGAELWLQQLGPTLLDFAIEASGGLYWNEDQPSFGYFEVEAIRQRYLFLFGLREILNATAQTHVSIKQARSDLEQAQYSTIPPPIIRQVRAFIGWFDLAASLKKKPTEKITHVLRFVKPRIISFLELIEAERIRRCAICELLFWADRSDKAECSPKCANVSRARRWRRKKKIPNPGTVKEMSDNKEKEKT